jgi:U3 small nucleolar RNA-associated protein 14
VTAATEKYKSDNDVFEEFREECLVEEDGARLDWKEVALPGFRKWAVKNGKQIPKNSKDIQAVFSEKLGKIFNSRFKGASLYGWRNIRLVC